MFKSWTEGTVEIDPDTISILKPGQFLVRAQVQEINKTKYSIPITRINLHLDENNPKLIALQTDNKEDANYVCEFESKVSVYQTWLQDTLQKLYFSRRRKINLFPNLESIELRI